MNSVSVAVFPQAPALLDLLCEEMFSVESTVAKEKRGKNSNFLNSLSSFFPFLCLCFDSSVCDGASHTAVLQPTCPAPLCSWPLSEPVQL